MDNNLKNNDLYKEVSLMLKPHNIDVLQTGLSLSNGNTTLRVYCTKSEGITSDDLEKAYNIIYLKLKNRYKSLFLEVSTPGCTRVIKDANEFQFFKNKTIKLYSESLKDWQEGVIIDTDDNSVTIKTDNKDFNFKFTDINKAKLVDK